LAIIIVITSIIAKEITSKEQILLTEGFENETFPHEGWTLNTTGLGFIRMTTLQSGLTHKGSALFDGVKNLGKYSANFNASHLNSGSKAMVATGSKKGEF